MSASKIEWTEQTWNPIVGCSLESPGCTNCYAMKLAGRLALMGTAAHYRGTTQKTKAGFVWSGTINFAPDSVLLAPLKRRKPTTYFVNSMSDLFHPDVPDDVIDRVFAVMALCPQHTFQVLTKRSARMRAYLADLSMGRRCISDPAAVDAIYSGPKGPHGGLQHIPERFRPLSNVWLGVSVEDQTRADERIPDLLATPAAVRFLSCEPLLGPVDLTIYEPTNERLREALTGDWQDGTVKRADGSFSGINSNYGTGPKIDWVIAGGESGPGARPMHPDWARSIRDQCAAAGVPFHFKQWGDWIENATAEVIQADGVPDANLKAGRITMMGNGGTYMGRGFFPPGAKGSTHMDRVGKRAAGRLLDGVTHDGMPA